MSFPIVGLVGSDWAQSVYKSEANKLGIGIRFANNTITSEELIAFAKECDLVCVNPEVIAPSTIKSAERAGVKVYPSSKTLEQLSLVNKNNGSGDLLSILIARSAHTQVASWPVTLVTEGLTISPLPGASEEQSLEIQLSALKLAGEIDLIGGFELLVDATDYKKLVGINWLTPFARFWTQIGSTTNYFEQYLRAVLDLPLGSTEITSAFTVTGKLKSDPASDDYRPYLHLMARNPKLKFDQSIKQVAISGSELESLLTEVIHAQQYFSGEIEE